MKNKLCWGVLAAALLPLPGQAGYLEVSPADVAAGHLEFTEERPISAETVLADDKGGFDLLGVSIRGDSNQLDAAQISVSALGQVVIRDGELSSLKTGKGISEFGYAKLGNEALLELIMTGDRCSPLPVRDISVADRGTIDLMDVVMHAPEDPLSDAYAGYNPEKMSFDTLSVSVEGTDECFMVNGVKMSKWRLSSADGSITTAAKGSGIFSLLPGFEGQYAVNIHLEDMNSFNPDGEVILQAQDSKLSMAMDASLIDHILETPDMSSEAVVPSLVAKFADSSAEFSYQNKGLYIPAARIIAHDELSGPRMVSGDLDISLTSVKDRVKLNTDIRLDGLVYQTLNMDLTIVPEGSGSPAMGMMAVHPLGALLPYLKLNSIDYAVDDKGLWDWFEAEKGRSPADYLHQYSSYLSMAPDEIADPVLGWLTVLAEQGSGKLQLKPENPVSFMDVAMASMMSPDTLGDLLGVSAE
jgi:hypothetical protein